MTRACIFPSVAVISAPVVLLQSLFYFISFQVFKTDLIHVRLFCIYFDLTAPKSFLHYEKNEGCIVSAIQFYGLLLILFLLLF